LYQLKGRLPVLTMMLVALKWSLKDPSLNSRPDQAVPAIELFRSSYATREARSA
jgi:hypothetical protein